MNTKLKILVNGSVIYWCKNENERIGYTKRTKWSLWLTNDTSLCHIGITTFLQTSWGAIRPFPSIALISSTVLVVPSLSIPRLLRLPFPVRLHIFVHFCIGNHSRWQQLSLIHLVATARLNTSQTILTCTGISPGKILVGSLWVWPKRPQKLFGPHGNQSLANADRTASTGT